MLLCFGFICFLVMGSEVFPVLFGVLDPSNRGLNEKQKQKTIAEALSFR